MSPNRVFRFLASAEIFPVALLIGLGMLSERFLLPSILVASAFWSVRWAAHRRFTLRTPADLPIAVLILLLPLTLWVTIRPDITLPQVLRLASGIVLYYAIVNWTVTPGRLRLAAYAMVLAGLGLAIFAPFSVQWNTQKLSFLPAALYDRFLVTVSNTANPNVMAGSLVLLFPLSPGLLLFSGRRIPWPLQAFLIAAGLLMAGMLVLTQSRGALVGMVASLVLLVLLRWRKSRLFLLLAEVVALVVGIMIGPLNVIEFLTGATSLGGLDGRMEVWSRSLYMIYDFPLTGIGMGTFTQVTDLLYPFFLYEPGSVEHAHNLYLQVAVDLGLPGLVAWLAVLVTAVLAAHRVYQAGMGSLRLKADLALSSLFDPALAAGLGAGLLASLAALIIHGFFDAVVWGMVRPAPLVWAVWGLAAAARLVVCGREIPR